MSALLQGEREREGVLSQEEIHFHPQPERQA